MACATCSALRHEIAALKEEIAAWEAHARDERRLDADDDRLAHWRVTLGLPSLTSAAILMLMADRPGRPINHLSIVEAMHRKGEPSDGAGTVKRRASNHMARLRTALRMLGAMGRLPAGFGGISTQYGMGWLLSPADAATVRGLVGEA